MQAPGGVARAVPADGPLHQGEDWVRADDRRSLRPLTSDDYLDAIRLAGGALAQVGERGLDALVPTCPDWTVAALLRHVGQVHRRATLMLRDHSLDELDFGVLPAPPSDAALVGWFRDGVDDLASTLDRVGPDAPVWNWTPAPQTAAFWLRRLAHETTVHRWDAEAALGDAASLPGQLAVDGIEELFTVFLPEQLGSLPPAGLGGTLHLHSFDEPGEWLIELTPGQASITRSHVRADAAVRGTASDLVLFLWNRRSVADLDVLGDRRVPERWRELFTW